MDNSLRSLLRREIVGCGSDRARERRAACWNLTLKIHYARSGAYCTGSGLLLSPDGYFITNHHVLDDNHRDVTVSFHAGNDEVSHATLEKRLCIHRGYDLVLARCTIPRSMTDSIESHSKKLVVASSPACGSEPVTVYGFKHDVSEMREGKITRPLPPRIGLSAHRVDQRTWLTDVDVEPGFSGGPVVRATTGELLGFTHSIYRENDLLSGRVRVEHGFVDTIAVSSLLNAYLERTQARSDVSPDGSTKQTHSLYAKMKDALFSFFRT